MSRSRKRTEAGTTLIEALAALAITALLVAVFVPFVSQIIGRWTTGQKVVEDADQVMRAIVRLQAEFATAERVTTPAADGTTVNLYFRGDSDAVVFAHALPGTTPPTQLETVAFTIDAADGATVLVRRTGDFAAEQIGADPRTLKSPNAVISGAYRMHFDYVAADGTRLPEWHARPDPPARVELTLQPAAATGPAVAPIVLELAVRGKLM